MLTRNAELDYIYDECQPIERIKFGVGHIVLSCFQSRQTCKQESMWASWSTDLWTECWEKAHRALQSFFKHSKMPTAMALLLVTICSIKMQMWTNIKPGKEQAHKMQRPHESKDKRYMQCDARELLTLHWSMRWGEHHVQQKHTAVWMKGNKCSKLNALRHSAMYMRSMAMQRKKSPEKNDMLC